MIHQFKPPRFIKALLGIQVICAIGLVVGVVYLGSMLHEWGMEGLGTSVGTMVKSFNEAAEAQ